MLDRLQKIIVRYTYKKHNFGTLHYTIFCRKTPNLGQSGCFYGKIPGIHPILQIGRIGSVTEITYRYTKFHENTPQKAATRTIAVYTEYPPPPHRGYATPSLILAQTSVSLHAACSNVAASWSYIIPYLYTDGHLVVKSRG